MRTQRQTIETRRLINDEETFYAVIAGKSLVTSSIATPGVYTSMFLLMPMKAFWRNVVHLHKLDKHINTLRSLEKRILAIEKE